MDVSHLRELGWPGWVGVGANFIDISMIRSWSYLSFVGRVSVNLGSTDCGNFRDVEMEKRTSGKKEFSVQHLTAFQHLFVQRTKKSYEQKYHLRNDSRLFRLP